MGGSEAKMVSTKEHQIVVQHSAGCQSKQIEGVVSTLKICFPNSVVGSYRTRREGKGFEVYCGKDKNTCKDKIFTGQDQDEDKEKAIIEAIKVNIGLA